MNQCSCYAELRDGNHTFECRLNKSIREQVARQEKEVVDLKAEIQQLRERADQAEAALAESQEVIRAIRRTECRELAKALGLLARWDRWMRTGAVDNTIARVYDDTRTFLVGQEKP